MKGLDMGQNTALYRAGFTGAGIARLQRLANSNGFLPLGEGRVFYVDPTKSASGSGTTPGGAFATLQEGIDACVADRGDVIIRMPGSEEPTAAIDVDKAGITIMASTWGAVPNNPEGSFPTYAASTYITGPVLNITQPCAILGLEFETRDPTSQAAVLIEANGTTKLGNYVWLKDCRFPKIYSPWGVELKGASSCRIEDCIFDGNDIGIEMSISGTTKPVKNEIVNCQFIGVGRGIDCTTNPGTTLVRGCVFKASTVCFDFNTNTPSAAFVITNNHFPAIANGDAVTDYAQVTVAAAASVYLTGNKYTDAGT